MLTVIYKYISFTTPEGYKVRDNKLFDERFLKNNLELYFAMGGCVGDMIDTYCDYVTPYHDDSFTMTSTDGLINLLGDILSTVPADYYYQPHYVKEMNTKLLKHLTILRICLTILYRTYVLYNIREDVYLTSSEYRNDPMFLRNHFNGDGTFEMPKIKKEDIDLEKIELIGYDKIAGSSADQIVHFFLDDYKFEVIWNDPLPRIEKLKSYKAVLSPNFSVYTEMPMPIKIYNTFRSRWCGAYLQSNGVKVIPTLAWGGPETFWFCFDGVEKKSVVAVSTLGVRSEKDLFMQGYNEMLRRINPEKIICYGKPFDEMKGDIVEVDYAKTNNLDKSCGVNGKYIKKTVGYVSPYREKGMGSAGGTSGNPKFPGWDPSKSPGEGYEWRGKGEPSSGKGAWYNPKTKETLHPDLDHPEPYGPHWDYNYPGGGKGYRVYPDGSITSKNYEGEICYA